MSYLVLARKYRPRNFEEVVGQEVLTRVLRGAIEEDRVGHAYLFCGPRGTGKTTTARILAKALNCEQGPTASPCGTCDRCRAIEAGSDPDVIEIDGASNRGIEDARALREEVAYAPMRSRYKVYIVDEVHMLTPQAFNALLKTLEEPPPHVKFLFATTELHKVIDTIRSRCQVLRLSLIGEETIARHLTDILGREGCTPGEGVTLELARQARGSLRDALSIADQLLALVGMQPTVEDARRLAGAAGSERLERLLLALEAGDRGELVEALPSTEGGEIELLGGLLESVRGAILTALCPAESPLLESDPSERARRKARAERLPLERLEAWLEELLHARERMALLPDQTRVVLEVALLDLCREESALPLAVLEERLRALELRLGARAEVGGPPAPRTPAASPGAAPGSGDSRVPVPPARREPPPQSPPKSSSGSSSAPPPAPRRRPSEPRGQQAGGAPGSGEASAGTTGVAAATATAPPPVRRSVPPSRAAMNASTTATWEAFLNALAVADGELQAALERRGRPVDLSLDPIVVQLVRPTPQERTLLGGPQALRACERVFAELTGRRVRVILEDTSERGPGGEDDFTSEVSELFTGQIEEER